MAGISTHVLDNHSGRPGAGMRIDFSAWRAGRYELSFHVGEFYERQGLRGQDPLFVDQVVPVRFAIADPKQHYHVPLLCTPWSASTYRGS